MVRNLNFEETRSIFFQNGVHHSLGGGKNETFVLDALFSEIDGGTVCGPGSGSLIRYSSIEISPPSVCSHHAHGITVKRENPRHEGKTLHNS